MSNKALSIAVLALCEVLAMALWFSATAAVPALLTEYGIDGTAASLLTSAVQAGFVCGTLGSAILGLADRLEPRRFFAVAALVGALANGAMLAVEPASASMVALRFVTGMCMAGVYPVGMKLAASWAKGDLGLLIGLLVGALALGSASPHLLGAFGGSNWRGVIVAASAAALLASLMILMVTPGPNLPPARSFRPGVVLFAVRRPALRLANLGYLGHMWELYAMWAWLGVFLDASFRLSMSPGEAAWWARLATFSAIGIGGAAGCLLGGIAADRMGRTTLTISAMVASGTCAVAAGFMFGAAPWALFLLCLLWGVAVIADSAQFSASITELSEPGTVGTMLTVQTCTGFALTLLTIHLTPMLIDFAGWPGAFTGLAAGPFLGAVAMWRLRQRPEASALAGGRR